MRGTIETTSDHRKGETEPMWRPGCWFGCPGVLGSTGLGGLKIEGNGRVGGGASRWAGSGFKGKAEQRLENAVTFPYAGTHRLRGDGFPFSSV